jgi:plastocyanin
MSLHLHKGWSLLISFVLLGLWAQGCAFHPPHNTIAILDEPTPPNFSISPPEMTIKAGEEVTWANHTGSVMQLSIWMGQDRPGLFQRLGSKIGLGSVNKAGGEESEERLKVLKDAFKKQQQELEEIRAQLQSTPEQQQALADKLKVLEEKLKEQEAQLAELKTGSPAIPKLRKLSHIPAFIHSFTTVRVKFDEPGHYTYTLFQSSPNRRSSMVQGSLIVLP